MMTSLILLTQSTKRFSPPLLNVVSAASSTKVKLNVSGLQLPPAQRNSAAMTDTELSREDVRDMIDGWYDKIRAIQGEVLRDFCEGAHPFENFWEIDTKLKELYISTHCAQQEDPREYSKFAA